MPEEAVEVMDQQEGKVAEGNQSTIVLNVGSIDPFNESHTSESPKPSPENPAPNVVKIEEPVTPAAEVTKPVTDETDTVDADEFLEKETGWKSWDEAKAAKAELEKFKSAPKLGELTPEAKAEYLEASFRYQSERKALERAEKLDPNKPKDAAEIIKTNMLNSNKDLTADDVDFIFSDKYDIPEKPKRTADQLDEEYSESVSRWERQVATIEKRMTIDAKMAKPELSKAKASLVEPEIPTRVAQSADEPTPESLEQIKAIRDNYMKSVEADFSKLDGFKATVKNESVQYETSFKVSDEDKLALKKLAQSINTDEYFGKRWFDEKGNTKVEQLMKDLYRLEYGDKLEQGIANNAASEMWKQIQKLNSNIKLNVGGTNETQVQNPVKVSRAQAEKDAIWAA